VHPATQPGRSAAKSASAVPGSRCAQSGYNAASARIILARSPAYRPSPRPRAYMATPRSRRKDQCWSVNFRGHVRKQHSIRTAASFTSFLCGCYHRQRDRNPLAAAQDGLANRQFESAVSTREIESSTVRVEVSPFEDKLIQISWQTRRERESKSRTFAVKVAHPLQSQSKSLACPRKRMTSALTHRQQKPGLRSPHLATRVPP
jgi:hypothetical protein